MGYIDTIKKEAHDLFKGHVSMSDMPKVVALFGGISTVYVAALFTGCWMFRPTKRLVAWSPRLRTIIENARAKHPKLQVSRKSGPFWVTFGETVTLKTLIGPVMLPAKVMLTLEIYKRLKNIKGTENSE
jgi:hypothetical protein